MKGLGFSSFIFTYEWCAFQIHQNHLRVQISECGAMDIYLSAN